MNNLTDKHIKKIFENLTFFPLTADRWSDFENLLGEKGGCGGCWCMWYRLKRSEYEKQKGEGNKKAMKNIVYSGGIPGIMAYAGKQPVAWCSLAPRKDFPVLDRSRILKAVDREQVWSIVCLYIEKSLRRSGLTEKIILAAIDYARKMKVKIIEGYPIDVKKDPYPDVFAGTGFYSSFRKLGFTECARRSKTRPIMRYYIKN